MYIYKGINAQGHHTYETNFPLIPKRFLLQSNEFPLNKLITAINTPTTDILFREFTATTDEYTFKDPPPHLDTMGLGNLFDTFPELGNDRNYDPISNLTPREFHDNLLNPSNIHAFREIFQRHSNGDSTCRTARIHFRCHYQHYSNIYSQLETVLRDGADIAAFTATCTQIKAHFT